MMLTLPAGFTSHMPMKNISQHLCDIRHAFISQTMIIAAPPNRQCYLERGEFAPLPINRNPGHMITVKGGST